MRLRLLVALVLLVAVAAGWYLFRPDALVLNRRVDEPAALGAAGQTGGANATLLAVGHLHDVRHRGTGTVTIHRRADSTMVLRLSELRMDNGPDLYVYLVAAPDAWDDETVTRAGFISLGRLKGNLGNQNYELPRDIDFATYRSVTIWCRRFGVNFATAALMTG